MKKTNTSVTKITVFFIFLLVLVVGYYAYLSGTHRTEQQEAVMSEIDTALSRNLENNYPSTPKEVVKYYNDLMKCFIRKTAPEEELQELGKKSLQLFDEELRETTKKNPTSSVCREKCRIIKTIREKLTSVSLAIKHKCGLLYSGWIFLCTNILRLHDDGKWQKKYYRHGISVTQR